MKSILLYLLIFVGILCFFSIENFDPKLGRGFEPNLDRGFVPGVEYTLTLGNWGKREPDFCFQTEPENGLNNQNSPIKVCNACKLACSTKEAWDRCQTCLKRL